MQYQKEIHDYLKHHQQEILALLEKLVAVRSVQGEAQKNAPFGSEPAKALHIMLETCQQYGFSTDNVDFYAGSADLNDKKPALGILAHLDVVPEGDGWTHQPYQMEYEPETNKLYGRGTSDDKGPAVAALFAMKAVKDLQIPMKSGVRLIFGTNEENGSEDLEYYMKHRTLPPMVFTPDGDYPVINLEKGMMRLKLSAEFTDGKSQIMKLEAGNVINAVPAKAEAIPEGLHQTITIEGRNAHASTPEQGENALTKLLQSLINSPLLPESQQTGIIRKLAECFPHGETNGKSLGIAAKDDISGGLTCVLSVMKMNTREMTAYVDIRFPVCCQGAEIIAQVQKALAPVNVAVLICDEPHYTDENSEFVQTLLHVYESVTGLKGKCLAIGGGTYVHHIEGGVAFGATFPDTDVHMHGADEFIKLNHLLLDAEMMALAITELCGE